MLCKSNRSWVFRVGNEITEICYGLWSSNWKIFTFMALDSLHKNKFTSVCLQKDLRACEFPLRIRVTISGLPLSLKTQIAHDGCKTFFIAFLTFGMTKENEKNHWSINCCESEVRNMFGTNMSHDVGLSSFLNVSRNFMNLLVLFKFFM